MFVDSFHDQNRFANTSTAEQADLCRLSVLVPSGRDNLNACHKEFRSRFDCSKS